MRGNRKDNCGQRSHHNQPPGSSHDGANYYERNTTQTDGDGVNRRWHRSRSRSRSRERGRDRYRSEDNSRGRDSDRDRHSHQYNQSSDRSNYYRSGGDGSRRDDEGPSSRQYQDRDRDRDRGRNRQGNSEPSKTVIIKGLPTHTTEPALYAVLANFSPQNIRLISQRGTAECKGFAFVEFFSIEYAEYFVKSFAGSMGDSNAPQLIVENRAVMIDYAAPRSQDDHSTGGPGDSHRRISESTVAKSDWLCETCGCQNFARRDKCYRCSGVRTTNAVRVTANLTSDPFSDISIVSATPSCTLAVRGLPLFSNEDQINEMFRQYALVKSVHVLRDANSNMSRGIAFVEFHSVDHAAHTMNSFNQTQQSSSQNLKVNFAKESFVQGLSSLQQQHMMAPHKYSSDSNGIQGSSAPSLETQNAYARAALAAAQWSAGPPAGSQHDHVPSVPPSDRSLKTAIGTSAAPAYSYPSYFETHGAAYIFQPKSGIFYDAVTKFYYCPKSRLYYSEADGRYVYAVASTSPSAPAAGIDFTEFVPPDPSTSPPDDSTATDKKTEELPAKRKPVTMSLSFGNKKNGGVKTDKLKLSAASITNARAPAAAPEVIVQSTLPSVANQVNLNIAKWSENKTDFGMNEEAASKDCAAPAVANASASSTTTSPAVICTLCQRQFLTEAQLTRHEKESKLHARNLAEAKLSEMTKVTGSVEGTGRGNAPSGKYRDRASERRAISGVSDAPVVPSTTDWVCSKCKCENFARRVSCFRCSSSISIANGGPPEHPGRHLPGGNSGAESNTDRLLPPSSSAGDPPVLNNDTENPGNQILRRLGWKDGQGLGQGGSGDVESVASKLERKSGSSSSTSVKRGVGAVQSGHIPPVEYGARGGRSEGENEYKSSVLRAAKARYDMMDSKK